MQRAYEVRCCCTPQKLMGVIVLDPSNWELQHGIHFPVAARAPLTHGAAMFAPAQLAESVHLTFALFQTEPVGFHGREQYYAIKAEGVPIEKLRRIPGFVEL